MSEVSSNQKNTNNAATNTGEAPRERGFVRPSRPMAPPKRGAVKKKIWEDFTGKPSASNPPTVFGITWEGGRVDFSSLVSMDVVQTSGYGALVTGS
ncbi:hypothetical protein NC653_005794 [Populus alba x Populus x berolinensis]|uniref:Uncharacterized protein n=1 Tax=Populus alba x Populus x berolinensis TaxID=444605 RepID=A0AAD6RD32_9ROSI|nr:hypothetical protein NC653_005794 [Populus alba x Populus x berolinensis]